MISSLQVIVICFPIGVQQSQKRKCVLPSGSRAKVGGRRVGVVEWEVIGGVVGVGVEGTMVVTDTLSTGRQGMG